MFLGSKLVVGGCLNSLKFALENELPIIISKILLPFEFDKAPNSEDYDYKIYNRLFFDAALHGGAPFSGLVEKVKISREKLSVFLHGRRVDVDLPSVEKVFVFYNKNIIVEEHEFKVVNRDLFRVYDWFISESSQPHHFNRLDFDGAFMKTVHFYLRNKNTLTKDCVVESVLSAEQLLEVEYSDTYLKFKLQSALRALGLNGRKNGIVNNKQKYLDISFSSVKREVEKMEKIIFEDSKKIEFG